MEKLKNLNWDKWMNNSILFFAPLFVLYLLFVQAGIQKDGFQLSDFVPSPEVYGGMILYLINTALDFFKKYKSA